MPFVTFLHRLNPDLSVPGDLCFVYYRVIMDKWNRERRWTTADAIFGYILKRSVWLILALKFNHLRAIWLAWQVFFHIHVMEYEQAKREQNGDIK